MGLKKYKPVTPGKRYKLVSNIEEITAKNPEKFIVIQENIRRKKQSR